jgi:hypothetical protein
VFPANMTGNTVLLGLDCQLSADQHRHVAPMKKNAIEVTRHSMPIAL